MGKSDGFLTPKAISNRIKAKGLQKLKFYCQMCEKQCRDANGFKCHCQSESHRRQMEIVQQQQGKFIDKFSKQFEKGFMDLVRTRYRSKKVRANKVYTEFIADRNHVHMNSTCWLSLTEFVKHLGRVGKVIAEDTPKGWYIRYIDREELQRQEEKVKNEKIILDEEARSIKDLHNQKMRALQELESTAAEHKKEEKPEREKIEMKREPNEKITFMIPEKKIIKPTKKLINLDDEQEEAFSFASPIGKKRAIEELKESEIAKSAKIQAKEIAIKKASKNEESNNSSKQPPKKIQKVPENWIQPALIVKIKCKDLAKGKYFNEKGIIEKVVDKFGAELRVIKDNRKMLLDQTFLETVIPAIGNFVMIVKGKCRGELGALSYINVDKGTGVIKLNDSDVDIELDFNSFCKVHIENK